MKFTTCTLVAALGLLTGCKERGENPEGPALTVNGTIAASHTVAPGAPIHLAAQDTAPGETLTLTESDTGFVWYRGPAADLRLDHRLLRTAQTELDAAFAAGNAAAPRHRKVTLRLPADAPRLYPGALVQIIRRDPADTTPPAASAFAPHAVWPTDSPRVTTDYPAFRTGEAVHAPADRITRPAWFHGVLPSLDIVAPPADRKRAAEHRQTIAARGAIHQYPLGDIGAIAAHARISGYILPERTGAHAFRWEGNLPARLTLGGKTVKIPGGAPVELTLDCADTRPIAFEIILTNDLAGKPAALDSRLLWKRPGDAAYAPLPAGALLHPVDTGREKALADATGNFKSLRHDPLRKVDDAAAPALLSAATAKDAVVEAQQLADMYLYGKTRAGDPALARKVFALVAARQAAFRSGAVPLESGPAFGKTTGKDMCLAVALQPFLVSCENHPALQREALAARAELAQYAQSTCLSRTFYGEWHHGANDGYNGDNNLIVNFWRAAEAIGSPYAWDAATMLFDNHFRNAPGAGEGLCSDGIFDFHNANGRHVHMAGYGTDWFNAITIGWCQGPGWSGPGKVDVTSRLDTPWAMTAEQYHRFAEWVLAYEWFFYRGTAAFITNGRHNHHEGTAVYAAQHAQKLLKLPEGAMRADDRTRLDALRERIAKNPDNSITGNRFFFRNLYAVHRRPDFFIDVKMTSPLVGGPETFAGGIPWNISFGDGVTTLMRDGGEYKGIHRGTDNAAYAFGWRKGQKAPGDLALWRFRQLPGTTGLNDEIRNADRYRGGSGTTAGGVSDGTLGHGAFHFANGNVGATARKLYAFTDDGMAVLATDIANTRPGDKLAPGVAFLSTLNQCDRRGPVRVLAADGKETVFPADTAEAELALPMNQAYWISHDGIGYLVLPTGAESGPGVAGTLRLNLETTTPLTPVPGFTPDAAQTALIKDAKLDTKRAVKTFRLAIDHGLTPKAARCAYFVCMRADRADAAAWLKAPPVTLLANEPDLQAVRDNRDGTTHAFFRTPGELRTAAGALLLATDRPASLMWRPETRALTAQDPVAACTSDISKMSDALHLRLGPALKEVATETPLTVALPGTGHPDDRYRGAPVTQPLPR